MTLPAGFECFYLKGNTLFLYVFFIESIYLIMALHRTFNAVTTKCILSFLQPTFLRSLPAACAFHSTPVVQNANRVSIVRCARQTYTCNYPVLLVRPDGSTIHIRYKEPRRILMMPVDITTLSEEERKKRLQKRDPRKTASRTDQDEFEDDFKTDDYSQFWKK